MTDRRRTAAPLVYGADSEPERGARRVRQGLRPAADRGDPAAPRAHRSARPPHARGGGRARAGRRGGQRLVLTHISDELDQTWARKQAADAFGEARRGRARGRGLRALSAAGVTRVRSPRDPRAGPVRQLRAHAARDRRAVRRRVRAHRVPRPRVLAVRRRLLHGRPAACRRQGRPRRRRTWTTSRSRSAVAS